MKMKTKTIKSRVILYLLLISSVFTLSGCMGGKTEQTGAQKNIPQELTIARVGDVGTMNPHLYDSDMGAQTLVYDPLVNLDKAGNIIPCLAASWEFKDEGLSLAFHLREDVKFSDGQEFNAQAVKQNFEAVLANAKRHSWLPMIDNLKSVEVTAPYTVVMHFKNPYPFTLLELTMVRPARFLSPGGFGADGVAFEKPVGTGPYILTEYVKDQRAVFVRNENYWGEKPKLEKITIRPVPDSNVRLNALMAGEVDLIVGSGLKAVSYLDLKNLKGNANLQTKVEVGDIAQFLLLNPSAEFLTDKAVREAICLAIDKQEINQIVYENMESVSDTMFSTKVPEILGKVKGPGRDLEKAKQLLASAGWIDSNGDKFLDKNGKTLEIMCNIPSDALPTKTLAEVVQAQLSQIGIKVKISSVESAVYYERKESGEFGIMPDFSWGVQYDPQSIYKSFRDVRPFLGEIFQGEAGSLFKQALTTMEPAERRIKFDRIADIFMNEEYIVIPTTVTPNVAVYNKKVQGFDFSANAWELSIGLSKVEIVE
ncbi:nickel ABC transporter, nickel/metallophore periplasmic binding protein [Desulfosporosinus meridiei DSM 13257]|uniref:Nickel ABC transporter, nickel/metallophore periplasmic binding protein n=2 Tax=Desulfosporosinus TaxID=79206 RepID=J7ILY8_DESMD|nr:nickel ABC transporter, nickel/metallophore periplasmic binding protein [Desulfosporosinus meridiei DSM 13257]